MKDITSVESLDIPAGVTVNVKARTITVEGPRGSLTKNTGHVQMDIQVVSRVSKLINGHRDGKEGESVRGLDERAIWGKRGLGPESLGNGWKDFSLEGRHIDTIV
jgi:ribosomal protein L6P/L9E